MSKQSQMVRPEATWNPVTGCIEVSSGCKTCYAEREVESLRAKKPNGVLFGCSFPYVQCHEDQMGVPLRWEKPHLITVSPLADLFHESVSFDFIAAIFGAMSVAKHHTFQVPTKRPKRMQAFFDWLQHESDRVPASAGPASLCYTKLLAKGAELPRFSCPTDATWPLPNVHFGEVVVISPNAVYILL